MTDYYEDEDFDSVYANNAILDLANVSLCLQKESLDELLKKDKAKVEKEDESCAWYHGKISRESAESLLKEGLSKLGPRDGLFLVRESTSSEGDFVLSVTHNFRVFQFQLKAIYDGHYRLDEGPIVQGLEKLITYYHGESTGLVTKLTQHCQGSAPPPQSRNMGPTTLLHRAVLEGDENIVENILKHPLCPDVNAKNEWGTTALHDCCKYGYNKIAELLIERKANVEMKDRQGLTPLHRACAANRPEMISVMIIKGKSNTQLSSPKTSWVPMHDAAMRGYVECVKELLKFHAPIWPRAEDEQTPLDLAIKYHRGSCVELLKSDDKRSVKTRREHWYHPNIVRQQAYDLLEESNKMDGLFLVRPSTKPSVHAVITFCHKRNNYNFEVKVKEYTNAKKPVYYIDNGPYFASLEKLIDHYSRQADGMTTRLTASISSGGETIPVEKENDYYNIDENGSNSPKAPVPSGRLNLPRRAESSGDMYSEPELKPKSSPPPLPHTHRPPKQQHAARPNLADTKQTSTDKSENPEFKKIIDAKDIKLGSALGEGEFGEVKKAVYHIKDGLLKKKKIDVAVKTFHQNEAGAAFESINREAILMQDLDHTCIVKLYGICQQPFMLVEEFVPKGALSDYLVKKHVDVDPTLYLWASQIASGMQYLEHKKIVHRDLAARNILVESEKQCKISDFGLSRAYEEESNYYKASKGGRWPIKWYAPECVNFGKFTHATDVWSYGVTLWEMFSYGDQPYEDMKGIEVIQYIETGKRLAKPKDCPDIVYQKMLACWKKDPKDRLTFDDLHRHFQNDPEYASALDIQRTRKALSSSASKRH